MQKLKEVNWRNVIIGVILILFGFIVGTTAMLNIANNKLKESNVNVEIRLF